MKLLKSRAGLLLLFSVVFFRAAPARFNAQESKTPERKGESAAPATARIWKSETSGKEYRVWTENRRFHAEWVNIPREFAAQGAYIRTVCRRAGAKWVGESRSFLPCSMGAGKEEHIANWCRVTTGFEVDSMTEKRITGRGEALKRFDCKACTALEKEWKGFVWVPKP